MNNFMSLVLRKYFKYTQWGLEEHDIPRESVLHFGTDCIADIENLQDMFQEFVINEYPQSVTEYYELLGYKRVVVLEPGEQDLDNYVLPEDAVGGFDLVVNAAASGKIFDQNKFFETMHNACSENGYLINVLPYYGQPDQHLYNYQPNFVGRLSVSNEYEVSGAWMSQDDYTSMIMFLPNYEAQREKVFEEYNVKDQENGLYLGTIFKKINNTNFRVRAE